MTRRLTEKEKERRARNRANAKASTGPRTAAGKARASRNAITHGLTARGPIDEAEAADRDRRAAALARDLEPESDVERALVDRLAAAFQRLEKSDHLEAQVFDGAFRLGDVPPGVILSKQPHCRQTFAVLNRYRATAAGELSHTLRLLEGLREARRRAAENRLRNEATAADSAAISEG
jgi:hypothetical protein